MLHTIEYRINDLNKRVIGIEKQYLDRQEGDGRKEEED